MIHAVIVGNNRMAYRRLCIESIRRHVPDISWSVQNDTFHEGMAANVQHAWDLFLKTDADYLLHTEEDFVWTREPPLDAAIAVLESHPRLAQMLFQRQPLTPIEQAMGSVVGGMQGATCHGDWYEQTHIFSLNPCLIPRRVIELGWPVGPLGVGNETGMTNKLLGLGYTFGVWDGQYVEHIGVERGPEWRL